MDKNDFTDQLQKLKAGELTELEVQADDFMAFQEAFMDFDARKRVSGTAQRGGTIVYTFEKDQKE